MDKVEEREERLINFRCNIDLLEKFSAICKESGSDTSKTLRDFMSDCVDTGEIAKRAKRDVNTSSDFRDALGGNIHNRFPRLW